MWANFRALIGIFSQIIGPSLASWANPVQYFVPCKDADDVTGPARVLEAAPRLLEPGMICIHPFSWVAASMAR